MSNYQQCYKKKEKKSIAKEALAVKTCKERPFYQVQANRKATMAQIADSFNQDEEKGMDHNIVH